jgi:hypothetical protein
VNENCGKQRNNQKNLLDKEGFPAPDFLKTVMRI